MTRLLSLFLLLSLCFSAFADEVRPKIGLVLSGGGAKGAAHLGVLKILEENRIPVDYIAGTSIGAYVAGMYALGYSAAEIEKLMLNENWSAGYSDAIPRELLRYRDKQHRDRFNIPIDMGYRDQEIKLPNGLLRGQTMSQLLQRSTGLVHQFGHFDDLAIPFRAVATNLETSEAVIISQGSIVKAMQASATVPGALQTVEYQGKLVVDGGIANNLPVDVVQALGADIIIAVDIGSSLLKRDALNSTLSVVGQLSTMLTNASTERQKLLLTEQDILIRPAVGEMSTTDFQIMPQAYALGEQAAQSHLHALQELSVSEAEYSAYVAKKRRMSRTWLVAVDRPLIELVVNNDSQVSELLIRDTLGILEGDVVTPEQLEAGVANIYALDKFERVDAEFTDTEQGRVLTLTTKAKSWGPNYLQLGFSWEDNLSLESPISFDVGYTLTDLTVNGGEWRNEIGLGIDKYISTEFYQPLDSDQLFYSRAKFGYDVKEWEFVDSKASAFEVTHAEYRLDLGIGYNYVEQGMVELGFIFERGSLENKDVINELEYSSYGGYVMFGFDDLDTIYFPTRGNRFTLNLYYRHDSGPDMFGTESSDTSLQIEADWRGGWSVARHAFVGIASLATVDQQAGTSVHISELGGFLNLSGYSKNSLVGQHKVFGAFVYQYDLKRNFLRMSGYPLYVGSSIEAGNVWAVIDSVSLSDLIYSGSLYLGADTGVGPTAIGFGWADDGEMTIFIFIGKAF